MTQLIYDYNYITQSLYDYNYMTQLIYDYNYMTQSLYDYNYMTQLLYDYNYESIIIRLSSIIHAIHTFRKCFLNGSENSIQVCV